MKRFALVFSILSIFSAHGFAGTMGTEDDTEPCWRPSEACSTPAGRSLAYNIDRIISFSIGPSWSNNGQSQTLTLQPNVQNHYQASFRNNVFPYGEIFFGMEKQLEKSLWAQLGVELGAGGTARFRGDIWENANPNTIDNTYSYKVNEGRILAKMKLLADLNFYGTRPFANVGLGGGFNHAYGYETQPTTPNGPVSAYRFNSKVSKSFAWTAGFGFEEILNEHWHASIGYEFANWGKSQLGSAYTQTVGEGLVVNNIYLNTLLLTLTYYIQPS